jgi:hypothetical protein
MFTPYSGCSFNSPEPILNFNAAVTAWPYGNIVDDDLPQIIDVTYFTSVNNNKLYLLKRNV